MAKVLDFARLSEAELACGVPLHWSSSDIVIQLKEGVGLTDIDWHQTCIVIRYGDPRLDEILESWRSSFCRTNEDVRKQIYNEVATARMQDYPMHGQRLVIVFADHLIEFSLIPKSLGTHHPCVGENDEEYGLEDMRRVADEFDPIVYHGGHADVAAWTESEQEASVKHGACRKHHHPFFLSTPRYVLQEHMGVHIKHQNVQVR
jgi:hypothetical protein